MEISARFVERPLSEHPLRWQRDAVRSDGSRRKLVISDAGIEMLAALVGRGMGPTQRRIVGAALRESLNGERSWGDTAEGDIFTEVYGEIFGPLMTCLERGKDYEIIRMVAAKSQTSPDMLLLERDTGLVVLQECKALYCDFQAIRRKPQSLDVCQRMRTHRNDGKKQLVWPEPDSISSNRVRVNNASSVVSSPVAYAEKSVVVTAVPDGRLNRLTLPMEPTAPRACKHPCVTGCIFTPEPSLITVLSSERVWPRQTITPDQREFLDWYKTCERAIWGYAHGSFSSAYSRLLAAWEALSTASEAFEVTVPFLTGLVEGALLQGVFVDFAQIGEAADRFPTLREALIPLHDLQGKAPRPRIRESNTRELNRALFGAGEQALPERELAGNWTFHARSPIGPEGRDGSAVEAHVRFERPGMLQLVLVPRAKADAGASDDLCWAISEILAGEKFPPGIVYETFRPEWVRWTRDQANESREFRLGRVLDWPWGFWPWIIDPRTLDGMRGCCPDCDILAHQYERHWQEGWHLGQHWRGHHLKGWPWAHGEEPMAFVTDDARAVLRVPAPVGTI